jgi:hypothetical protein
VKALFTVNSTTKIRIGMLLLPFGKFCIGKIWFLKLAESTVKDGMLWVGNREM